MKGTADGQEGSGMASTLSITAHPADPKIPTVGPWTLECSEHGILGVAHVAASADGALYAHYGEHINALKGQDHSA